MQDPSLRGLRPNPAHPGSQRLGIFTTLVPTGVPFEQRSTTVPAPWLTQGAQHSNVDKVGWQAILQAAILIDWQDTRNERSDHNSLSGISRKETYMTGRSAYPPPTRPVVMGTDGMVSAGNMLATMAGVRMLADGGNAFDAAVAVGTTLGVVEPYHSGPGGVGTAIVRLAGESKSSVLDFTGRSPGAADPERHTAEMRDLGVLAPMVPGNVAGWLELHSAHGALDREQVFGPAIDYAENGYPTTYQNSSVIDEFADRLRLFSSSVEALLESSGQASAPGTRRRWPLMADSLRLIAQQGRDAFYTGELAERMVADVQRLGGILTLDDFARYEAEWQDALSVDYRGYQVFAPPLPSCGFQLLQHLKLMESFDSSELEYQSADTVHATVEAAKLSIADRIALAGDPDHITPLPLEKLLSSEYAAQQKERIDMSTAAVVSGESFVSDPPAEALTPGSWSDGGNTTHFEVVDRDGNAIGITQTLGGYFGCAVAVGGTGFFLNNMTLFADSDESAPNRYGPGRKIATALGPSQTFKDGRFVLTLGMPGGWAILQRTVQIMLHLIDFGMDVQQAIEAPQFRQYAGRDLHFEDRLPVQVRRELEARGHQLTNLESWSLRVSGAHGILLDEESGTYMSGCCTRREGYAIGL